MPRRTRTPLCVSLAALLCAASLAAAAETALPKGDVVLDSNPTHFAMTGAGAGKTESKIVVAAGQPFAKAWHVMVKERLGGEYNAQFVVKAPESLKQGDVILMSAWARMLDTQDESGEGRFTLVLEQAKDPYNKVFANSFGVGRQWQRFDVPAVIREDLSKTGGQFTVRVGAYAQTLEIGGVEVRKMRAGTDVNTLPKTRVDYAGRAENAPWRKAAAERIERIRKADLAVTVVDASGKPVSDATVAVRMTRHAFPFGSCYAPRKIVGDESADAKKYREVYLQNFNTGVDEFAMKWPGWVEPQTQKLALDALAWMQEHHVAVRGHTMVWPGWKRLPPFVKDLASDPTKLSEAIHEHIRSVGEAMRGKVIDWDVVNEPFANNDLLKILGERAMVDWFKWAREADPEATLYLNETSVPTSPPADERYTVLYDRAKMIKDAGGPIGGVGMQSHFGQNVQPPPQLLAIYDRFQQLGLPVRITELDIDSNDEELQADYFRDFLTASFSHPNINGVMLWGFWESSHWRPNAAMFRKDWSPRPTAGVWRDLVYKQWWTSADGKTDAGGTFATRGFLGDYDVTVTRGGKTATLTFTLDKNGAKPRVTLSN